MTSIEAMKKAAAALNGDHHFGDYQALVDELRAAIAEQEKAQPVAWMDDFGNTFPVGANKGSGHWLDNHKRSWVPLYTHPSAPSAPPGYVLVPVEPTFEMLQSADDMHDDVHISRGRAYDAWGRMLAAAPKVSSVPLLTHLEIEKLFYSEQKNKWWKVDFNSFVSISRAIERRIRGETT